jgi:hypothetical protein
MPWDKKPTSKDQVYATVGALVCYKVKKSQGDDDEWDFTQFWVKTYGVQTGSLHWSETEDILYVGFDDGSIHRYQISDNGHAQDVSFLSKISFCSYR